MLLFSKKSKISNRYHPDVPLFLIIIPLISAFNYYLTYSNIQANWFLLLTFSIDTVTGYLAWWGARAFIFYLDKKQPYEQGPLRRIFFQQIGVMIIGLLIISLLTELSSWIAKGRPAPLHFYTRDLFIISIWFFVINGIYIGLYYYRQWQQLEDRREEENRIISEGFVFKYGKKDLRLNFEELAGFYVESDYIVVSTLDGKKYYLNQSLEKVEKILPASHFFRLNRQFILSRKIISGFKRAENGKIQVQLNGNKNLPAEVPVSRTKAPSFKNWFRQL